MNVLTIDVTGPNLIVAVCKNNQIEYEISEEAGKKHNALVIPFVEKILTKLNMTIQDIDVFSCVVGPGSFTGIRIGIATIKAFCFATKKPCVSINSLEEAAYGKDGEFYITLDALHGNCYGAKFTNSWEQMSDLGCYPDDKVKTSGIISYEKAKISNPINLINITIEKANKGQFSVLEPLYLRKSQAERDLDGE